MTTKNGDMPAMPVDRCDVDAIEAGIQVFSGLTKREMMAMHMMAAVVNAAMMNGSAANAGDAQQVAMASVFAADALLAELERTK